MKAVSISNIPICSKSRKIPIAVVLLLALCCCLLSHGFAEQAGYTFENIDWYTDANTVDQIVGSMDGVRKPIFGAVDKNAKIDSWFRKWKYFYTEDAVENGGVIFNYNGVKFEGYTAQLSLSFVYSIDNDNRINRDYKAAELYMAVYTIDNGKNLYGIYEDLKGKLKATYGQYVSKSFFDGGMEGVMWTADDGSIIWLRISQNTVYKNYEDITITFFAPDGLTHIERVSQVLTQEVVDRNSDNMDGL